MRMTRRIWMTGCMALVLLAAGRGLSRQEDDGVERSQRPRITMTSKFDLDETVRQIERTARKSGVAVLARAVPPPAEGEGMAAGETRVLVLGDDDGRTPVTQADGGQQLDLPWKVVIRLRADGQTEVSLPHPEALEIPPEDTIAEATLARVSALPRVLQGTIT